jgi:hypothetical protein
MEVLRDYLERAAQFEENRRQIFSIDIRERIFSVLQSLQPDKEVRVPKCVVDGREYDYAHSTFRLLKVNQGGMNIHCDGMFRGLYPNFYTHVESTVDFSRQFSHFIVLQRPGRGGQLRVYNAEWTDYPSTTEQQRIFKGRDGFPDKAVSQTAFREIDPMPGDMVVFRGGDLWHAVTNAIEGPPRITIGGFFTYSLNKSVIFVWS